MGPRQYYVAVGSQDAKLTTLAELLQALQADGACVALAIACGSRDTLDSVVAALAECGTFALAVLHSDLTMAEAVQQVTQVKEGAAVTQQRATQEAQGEGPAASGAAAGEAGLEDGPAAAAGVEAAAAAAAPAGEGGAAAAAAYLDVRGGSSPPTAAIASQAPAAAAASLVLVSSDACLKALPKDILPLGLPLLIQFDIPPTKDVFTRRMAAVFGGSKERRRGAAVAQRAPVVIDFVVAGELPAFRTRERFSTTPVMEMPVHVPDIL